MYIKEQPRKTTFEFFHQPEEKMSLLEHSEIESLESVSDLGNSTIRRNSSLKRNGSIKALPSYKRAAGMDGPIEENDDGKIPVTNSKTEEIGTLKEKKHL